MVLIPTCMVGGSDEDDVEIIKTEIEKILIKGIIDKIVYKFGYFLVYFVPITDKIDARIIRFIHIIQQPTKYIMLHYKNDDTKIYSYIKKAPYKLIQ